MASWNEFRESVSRAASTAWQKTGEIADMTSMRVKLKLQESKRDEQYKELGRLTYRQIKTGESQAEKIAPVVEQLDEIREKIRALKDEIEVAKQERAAKKEAAAADEKASDAATEDRAEEACEEIPTEE